MFTLISNAANYITVILDNSLVFRVTIPDAVLTLRSLTLYIYGAPILDVSRSHTTTQHSR